MQTKMVVESYSSVDELIGKGHSMNTIEGTDSYALTEKGSKMMLPFLDVFDKNGLEKVIQKVFGNGGVNQKISQDDFLKNFVILMSEDGFEGYDFYNKLHTPLSLNYIVDLVDKYDMNFQLIFCHLAIIAKEKAKSPDCNILKQDGETLAYIPYLKSTEN